MLLSRDPQEGQKTACDWDFLPLLLSAVQYCLLPNRAPEQLTQDLSNLQLFYMKRCHMVHQLGMVDKLLLYVNLPVCELLMHRGTGCLCSLPASGELTMLLIFLVKDLTSLALCQNSILVLYSK